MRKVILIIFAFLICFNIEAKFGWEKLNSRTNLFLYGVCFVDSLNGWVVGDDGIILKTTDGGISWDKKDANIGSWLLSVYFIDRNYGWVCGDFGDLRKTTDGGENWEYITSITYPEMLNSIFFADRKNGWAVGPNGIIHSSDGGYNWEYQYGDSIYATKSIFFINKDVGWCSGANGEILHTADGGINWYKQKTPTNGIIYDVFFLNLSIGWAVSRNKPNILKTTNGGNDWFVANSNVDGFYKRIQFVDEMNGWAAGPDGIIRTTDGGFTWKKQMSQTQYNIWWANFINENIGWAVGGNGTILKTDNGGYNFIVDFEANVTDGIAPLSTTFTNLTQGDYNSSTWEFGDGGTHKTINPIYIYQNPGKYDVKLVVSNGMEKDSVVKYNYITVRNPSELVADFIADTTEGNEPLTVQFTDLSKGTPEQWLWDFGDGGTHTTQNPIHIYQNFGTYTVKLTIKRNNEQASEVKTDYIKVHKPIDVNEYYQNCNVAIIPNPNDGKFELKFYNRVKCNLKIELLNLPGESIKVLFDDLVDAGAVDLNFILNSNQTKISDGIYYLLISFGNKNEIIKPLILMK